MNPKFDAIFEEPDRNPDTSLSLTGVRIGDYLVGECLANQLASQVYLAEDQQLCRKAVVKVLRQGEWLSRDASARFHNEQRVLAQLRHPNIVSIFACYSVRNNPCIVMEYMGGGTLADYIGKPFQPWEAVRILLRIARGVADAHTKGIVHRDLKPQNILIDHTIREPALETSIGFLKISDFGIAKMMNDFEGLTRSGMQPGTVNHMAPEQIDSEMGAISPATDVFALGIMLYQLLTGENPFSHQSVPKTLRNIVELPVPLVGARVPEVPEWLETICETCLQKSPMKRFANAEALAREIERCLKMQSFGIETPVPARKSNAEFKRWSMKALLAGTICALFLIALYRVCQSFLQ